MALVIAMAVLLVISVSLTGVIYFSSANARSSNYSKGERSAVALAEAGLNNALAAIMDPSNDFNLDDPAWLATARTSTYPGGTVTWSGQLLGETSKTLYWRITATSSVRNPTGPGTAPIHRTLYLRVPLKAPPDSREALEIWNWIYNHQVGNACDMTIDQSVALQSPLFVRGNLCLRSTATIANGPLVVGGNLTLSQPQNSVGSAGARLTNKVRIGGWCQYKNYATVNLCAPEPSSGPSNHTNVFALNFNNNPSDYNITLPPVYWSKTVPPYETGWYEKSSPGPNFPCRTVSGTPPVFDTKTATGLPDGFNNSVGGVVNLTPPSQSYTCITRRGQLSWDSVSHTLTVRGTIFIDGSATIQNNTGVIHYVQQPDVACITPPDPKVDTCSSGAVLYLGGTLLIKNSTVCGTVNSLGTDCDQYGWNPNVNLFVAAAYSTGGQCPTGTSVCVVSSTFQGALYGKGAIDASTTSKTQGPLVSETEVRVGQTNGVDFPDITITPIGMPGFAPEFYTPEDPEFG
ncbi:MAG TPA: pilus assembly PilX N-terminal domain-containing protein [Gaiellaceae bacterium]|nr:pilus assembly PilX N-terminal domain-containing protein [Gaiellaceae bacterium]